MEIKKKRFVRIMAWILAAVMAGSCGTLIVSLILYMVGAA